VATFGKKCPIFLDPTPLTAEVGLEPTDFVKSVIESFGFAPIYLGGLATGGRLQQAGGPLAGRDLVDFGGH
jgi:hypothetical protein